MELKGKIEVKGTVIQVSEKFRKLDFVIKTDDQYPQLIPMQLTNDRCALIDKYNIGDEIKCHINHKGRAWTSPQGEVKYFLTIEAWKIEGLNWTEEKSRTAAPAPTSAPAEKANAQNLAPQSDDLPFSRG